MKAKYDIVKLLDYLRAKTDPKFKNNDGIFYDPKITKKEKYDHLIEINLLKWILSDYDYDQKDMDRETKLETNEDLKWAE